MAVSTLLATLFGGDHPEYYSQARGVATVLLFISMPALFARRLHDCNVSGLFAGIMLLVFVVAVFGQDGTLNVPGFEKVDFGFAGAVVMFAGTLFFWALLLLPPVDPGNRFDPDPRIAKGDAEFSK